jgi:hypothetical protein
MFKKKENLKMSALKKFGENVEGYDIPVLNEREIRASAVAFAKDTPREKQFSW